MIEARKLLSILIVSVVSMTGACYGQSVKAKSGADRQHLVHLELINMSGKSREAHLRKTVVELPVARRVQLQAREGESIRITSSTDQKIARTITVASTDEGRVIPVE